MLRQFVRAASLAVAATVLAASMLTACPNKSRHADRDKHDYLPATKAGGGFDFDQAPPPQAAPTEQSK